MKGTIHELATTVPRGTDAPSLEASTDPDELSLLNADAAAMHGAGAVALLEPRSEAQLCVWLARNPSSLLLTQGALTSLTGGATPDGDTVVSTKRLRRLEVIEGESRAVCGSGLVLADLQEALAARGLWYPPAPTHDGATIGGNVATNAAGAATFKYGSTRDWVRRIRLALRHGEVLELRRGEVTVHPGDEVVIRGKREVTFRVPTYETPRLRKISAGYFVREPMDLLDLFIGAEGTLGIVTEVEVAVTRRPRSLTGLVLLPAVERAIGLVHELRRLSIRSREDGGGGLDARSIEFFDLRCLQLLRDAGRLGELGVTVPDDSAACLLFEVELDESATADSVMDELAAASEGKGGTGAVSELWSVLTRFGAVEHCELAMPDQARRHKQLAAVREAIPLAVSEWLKRWQREDPGVQKAGGDMIVPMDKLGEMLERYYDAFSSRGVDLAVFGHISDGNLHPNALPRSADDVQRAKQALLELADTAKSMGGSPLSEHGVGKHPLKRIMLERYWGASAMGEMRAVKDAFDPDWTLNRGVLFEPQKRRGTGVAK